VAAVVGQIFALFVIVLAAAEAGCGLAIIQAIYQMIANIGHKAAIGVP